MLLFLIVTVLLCFRFKDSTVKRLDSETHTTYEDFITPLVMCDPTPFLKASEAVPSELITASVWSILSRENKQGTLEYINGILLLSESDVEKAFQSLFGKKMWFSHLSVDGGGVDFTYSEKDKAYIIPLAGVTPEYTPEVTEVYELKGDTVVTVAYLDSQKWLQDSEGNIVKPEPTKYMKIILTKNSDGTFFVESLEQAE